MTPPARVASPIPRNVWVASQNALRQEGCPQRWEAFLASDLLKHGSIRGNASSCVFVHSTRDFRCVVHGDDFIFAGADADLDWIEARMHESFLIKIVGKLGG